METLIQTGITIIAGFIGYGIREYQNKIKPFVTFQKILHAKKNDIISIPSHYVNALKNAIYCKGLKEEIRINNFDEVWDRCDDFKRFGLETIQDLTKLMDADDNSEFSDALSECLKGRLLDKFIMVLLVNDLLDFKDYDEKDITVEFTIEKDNGVGFFHFPRNGVGFGRALNHPAIWIHVKPFVETILTLDMEKIKYIFQKIKLLFQEEYNRAVSIYNDLSKINDQYDMYGFAYNITNLSSKPIAINNSGKAIVKLGKNKYPLDVRLASSPSGDEDSKDIDYPLSIKSGESRNVIWFTNDYVAKTKYGDEIINIHDKKNSLFRVEFKIFKIGLLKRFTYQTPYFNFQKHKEKTTDNKV